MSNSDSFFDDDSMDDLPGAPSEELLRESADSLESPEEADAIQSDTPDAALSADELAAEESAVAEESAATDEATEDDAEATLETKRGFLGSIDLSEVTIYDAILLVSLLFVSIATLLMFFELRDFGNFPFGGFPWRTDEF